MSLFKSCLLFFVAIGCTFVGLTSVSEITVVAQESTEVLTLEIDVDRFEDLIEAIWSRDETRVLAWTSNGHIKIWDAETGQVLWRHNLDREMRNIVWDSDENRVIAVAAREVVILDTVSNIELNRVTGLNWNAVLHANSNQVAIWNWDNGIQIFDTISGTNFLTIPREPSNLEWNGEGNRVLIDNNYSDLAEVWDITTGEIVLRLDQSEIRRASWNSQETRIVTWQNARELKVWDSDIGAIIFRARLPEDFYSIDEVLWNSNGRYIAVHDGNSVWVFDAENGTELAHVPHSVSGMTWSHNGAQLFTWGTSIQVLNVEDGTVQFVGDSGLGAMNAWNTDDDLILVRREDRRTVQVVDGQSGAVISTMEHEYRVHIPPIWINNGRSIVTLSEDLRVWDTTTGGLQLRMEDAPTGSMSLNRDYSRLLTWSSHGTVEIWDTNLDNAFDGFLIGTAHHGDALWASRLSGERCPLTDGETVLAVANSNFGPIGYAAGDGCEGLVLLNDGIVWESEYSIDDLPQIELELDFSLFSAIEDLTGYTELCASAAANGQFPEKDGSFMYYSGELQGFAPDLMATYVTGVDVLICTEEDLVTLQTCNYREIGGSTFSISRMRHDITVDIVNYATNRIIASRRFNGSVPPACPETMRGRTGLVGLGPHEEARAWIESQIRTSSRESDHTRIAAQSINAYYEANVTSDVLAELESGIPVNLIARHYSDAWVVALLPDMSKAWIEVNFLNIGLRTQIQDLPEFSGPASEAPFELP
ncbi:MAG: WD40 repeat domain-containing protein [Anaerolineae bacterium]|nr:WD40 repeat domain-containing protein [Anaerolineae bacterium]